jgi:hypothetical protein
MHAWCAVECATICQICGHGAIVGCRSHRKQGQRVLDCSAGTATSPTAGPSGDVTSDKDSSTPSACNPMTITSSLVQRGVSCKHQA